MQVLIVEDERRLAALLRQGLAEEGHSVVVAHDGREGLETALAGRFDAIILDVMLPVMDGLAVARRLRQARNQTPILVLTALDSTADVIDGLDLGADDYLTKPFRFDVLLARLRAVSRRGPVPRLVRLQVGDLVLNTASRQVLRGNQPVRLAAWYLLVLALSLGLLAGGMWFALPAGICVYLHPIFSWSF